MQPVHRSPKIFPTDSSKSLQETSKANQKDIEFLFEEPRRYGLRGDPILWQAMKQHFLKKENLPSKNINTFEEEYDAAFSSLTGKNKAERNKLKEFDVELSVAGGVSTVMISMSFWKDEGLPLLIQRMKSLQS